MCTKKRETGILLPGYFLYRPSIENNTCFYPFGVCRYCRLMLMIKP